MRGSTRHRAAPCPSTEAIRRSVLTLLAEPSYAEAAARLRAAYAAHDGTSRVVEVVLELATERQASSSTLTV
jgi:UDP:flavonoid glycosyltransferase YjiC (YdhE family)